MTAGGVKAPLSGPLPAPRLAVPSPGLTVRWHRS